MPSKYNELQCQLTPVQAVVVKVNQLRKELMKMPHVQPVGVAVNAVNDLATNNRRWNRDDLLMAAAVLIVAVESMPTPQPGEPKARCERNHFCNCNGLCREV